MVLRLGAGHFALPNDLCKMPLTYKYLIDKIESLENFHRRKIDNVINNMIEEERKLIRHIILREAGISDKYYHNYDNYIEQKIEQTFYRCNL